MPHSDNRMSMEASMKSIIKAPRPRSGAAKALADARYRKRVVRNKKKYSRKGRKPSTRQFKGPIQGTVSRALIGEGVMMR